jgi:hypothetical protein
LVPDRRRRRGGGGGGRRERRRRGIFVWGRRKEEEGEAIFRLFVYGRGVVCRRRAVPCRARVGLARPQGRFGRLPGGPGSFVRDFVSRWRAPLPSCGRRQLFLKIEIFSKDFRRICFYRSGRGISFSCIGQ